MHREEYKKNWTGKDEKLTRNLSVTANNVMKHRLLSNERMFAERRYSFNSIGGEDESLKPPRTALHAINDQKTPRYFIRR